MKVQAALGLVHSQEQATLTVLQIESSAREVEKVLAWPTERVKSLRQKLEIPERVAGPSRTHY